MIENSNFLYYSCVVILVFRVELSNVCRTKNFFRLISIIYNEFCVQQSSISSEDVHELKKYKYSLINFAFSASLSWYRPSSSTKRIFLLFNALFDKFLEPKTLYARLRHTLERVPSFLSPSQKSDGTNKPSPK